MRVIGIVGRAFCGSTILSRMLNAVPDVVSVGEAYQILAHPSYCKCTSCGDECRYINSERFQRTKPRTLYQDVASVFDTDILIVSDKSPKRYKQLVQPGQTFDAIVMYKSPQAFAASDKRGHPDHVTFRGRKAFRPLNVRESLRLTAGFYARALRWEQPRRKAYLSLEQLVRNPHYTLSWLCWTLNLTPPPRIDFDDIKWHNVMGNKRASKARKLSLDLRWKHELLPKEKKLIAQHKRIHAVYQEMENK